MHLVRATAWRRHGSAALAAAEAAAFISCHAGDPEDTMHAYATLALIANDRQGAYCYAPPPCRPLHVDFGKLLTLLLTLHACPSI